MLCKITYNVTTAEKSTYIIINAASIKAKKLPYLIIIYSLIEKKENKERNKLILINGWFNI